MNYPIVEKRVLRKNEASPSLYYSANTDRNIPCWLIPCDVHYRGGQVAVELAIAFCDPVCADTVAYSRKMHALCAFDSSRSTKEGR